MTRKIMATDLIAIKTSFHAAVPEATGVKVRQLLSAPEVFEITYTEAGTVQKLAFTLDLAKADPFELPPKDQWKL